MVAELKKALADAAALRAALANLSGQVERQVEREFVRRNAEGRLLWLPDHACQRCVPNSDILIPGFECDRHRALTVLAATHPGEGWASPSEVEALREQLREAKDAHMVMTRRLVSIEAERDTALARARDLKARLKYMRREPGQDAHTLAATDLRRKDWRTP